MQYNKFDQSHLRAVCIYGHSNNNNNNDTKDNVYGAVSWNGR